MLQNDDRPTIEEAYTSANTSSNLRVEADKRGDADLLIAAGWSGSRIGMALMRLHAEYDSTSIPPGGSVTDAVLLQINLKTLPNIREQVGLQAAKWGIERPHEVSLAVVAHWLDKNCNACQGRKFQSVPGTPSLSAKHCKTCHGSGESRLRYGNDAKRLITFMDDCVSRAQQSIKKRLHNN